MLLLTAHRRENWGKPLENIFRVVKETVDKYENVKVVYPVHKNPVVKEKAYKILGGHERIKLTEPLNVIDFHNIIAKSVFNINRIVGGYKKRPLL